MHAWNQGGIVIVIYDISLLQFLFCKNAASLKEWVAAVTLLQQKKRSSSSGLLQLGLRINSKPSRYTLCKKCPYLELFWSTFSRIRTEYIEICGKMRTRITPNTDTFHAVMMTLGACLKKHSTLENTRSLQMPSWNDDGVTQMYGCKCSFGNNTA